MKKVMLLAAMLAMVLVAAAPAFAQATGGDVDIQVVDCSQVAAVAAAQGQYGDATATSGDVGSAASADIANQLGISVEQVNACLGTAAGDDVVADDDAVVDGGDDNGGDDNGAAAGGEAAAGGAAAGGAAAAAGGTLPDTGGASLIALGAGALLVAGGLVARRIVR